MMYDDRYVYIGAHIGDPHPMRSIQDPYIDPEYPWRGGSVIVRLAASRSLGWPLRGLSPYFRSDARPGDRPPPRGRQRQHRPPGPVVLPAERARRGLRLSRGMDFHGDLIDPAGWEGAFRRDPDGLGYTLEYAIPWSLLCPGPETPRGGDVTATCWTVHWSDGDGKLSRGHLVDITNPAESGFDHMYSFMRGPSWGKAVFHEAGRPRSRSARLWSPRPRKAEAPMCCTTKTAVIMILFNSTGKKTMVHRMEWRLRGSPRSRSASVPAVVTRGLGWSDETPVLDRL